MPPYIVLQVDTAISAWRLVIQTIKRGKGLGPANGTEYLLTLANSPSFISSSKPGCPLSGSLRFSGAVVASLIASGFWNLATCDEQLNLERAGGI